MLSVIIPVLNEASEIRAALLALQALRSAGNEIIVADGGSTDATRDLARDLADAIIDSPRGRAMQMNAAARNARGDILVFLHADTVLPDAAAPLIADGLGASGKVWGRFDARIAGASAWFPVVGFMMNWRSRITGIASGDQAIFVRRAVFEQIGGFPPLPLMEDIALSARLKRRSRPLCLREQVATSGRRWERHGVLRTVALMWWLRLRYFFGASPADLARRYYRGEGK